MTRCKALCGATATIIALARAVQADITPMDVWNNQTALARALGGEVSASLSEGGTTTAVRNISIDFALPLELGTASVRFDKLDLVDNGDGTVTVRSPADLSIVLSYSDPRYGQGSVTLRLKEAYEQIASGDPGDITYSYDVPILTVYLEGFDVSELSFKDMDFAELADADISGSSQVLGSAGKLRITEGELLSLTFDASADGQVDEYSFDAGDGSASSHTNSTGEMTSSGSLVLPAGGASIMALSAALRDGLSVDIRHAVEQYETNDVTRVGGDATQTSKSVIARIATEVSVNADGLHANGEAEDVSVEILDTVGTPFMLDAVADAVSGAISMPLLATEGPEPFEIQFSLEGVSLSDEYWDEFDPGGLLPRDPATLNVDVAGEIGSEIDLLDFEALSRLEDQEEQPFSIYALTLRDLLFSATGLELTGSGDVTFDMDDMETFDGFPAATGMLDMMLVGGNRLIDTLVEMGVLPEDRAMGTRMTMGLFAQPGEGEDTLIWNIEADGKTGQILINGQRIR